jgi:TPR repeat protein
MAAHEVWLRTRESDFQTGLRYLKTAAERGYVPACLVLGKMLHDGLVVERDIAGALRLFEEAAAASSAAGWNSLGVCHEELGALVEAQMCYRFAWLVAVSLSILCY